MISDVIKYELSFNFDMYLEICEGWLHCFRHPSEYLPTDKPIELISESDFINYKTDNLAKFLKEINDHK